MTVDDKEENIEFKWGKKREIGGKSRDVLFYESFTYDGVEYSLFDSVYVYKEGEEEPYIGKLIEIWENADKTKKVKILWFFRPCEILNFLPRNETRDNELFLASGKGLGLTNVNPLEALVGKCNVVCISKDSRNPQPPDEEVGKAEYVFYRVFHVGHRKVSDKLDDQIAGYDVKFLLNKLDSLKPVDLKDIDKKEVNGKDMVRNEVVVPPSRENIRSMTREENGKFFETLVAKNTESKSSLGEKPTSTVGLVEACKSNMGKHTIDDKSMPMVKANGNGDCNASLAKQKSSNKKQFTSGEGLERQLAKGYDRSQKISGERTALRSKVDEVGGNPLAIGGSDKRKVVKGDGNFTHDTNGLVEDEQGKKTKLGDSKRKRGDGMQRKRLVHDHDDNDNSKTLGLGVISSKAKYKLERDKDSSDAEGPPFHNKPNISGERMALRSKVDEVGGKLATIGGSDKHKNVKGDGKVTHDTGGLVEDKQGKKTKLGDSKRNLNAKLGDRVQRRRLVDDDDNDNDNIETLGLGVISSKDKYKLRRDKDSSDAEGPPSKSLKLHNNPTKFSHDKLHDESSTKCLNGEQKMDSCGYKVTRRLDVDENKLFKELPWEDRMKLAHEHGTLVLLQNLDPSLTSQEVEDLVRHAFQENCTGKIIHAAAYSSPHSGQAFVIFGRREAAEQAVRKLNRSCLLMSNGRPLVGSFGNPCFPEKKPKFYGHIVIDQLRMQMRREMKDAVSTSHCSQSNNVEYDMAVDWCLLQERTDYAWEKLFRQQGEELKNVKAKLKVK